jgi:hypothetical protein
LGEEERFREFTPGEPMPAAALARFPSLWLAGSGARDDEERDVVPPFGREKVAGVGAWSDGIELEARLFQNFATRASLHRLPEFQMSSWRSPGICAVRTLPLSEKDAVIAEDQDADADLRLGSWHGSWRNGAA